MGNKKRNIVIFIGVLLVMLCSFILILALILSSDISEEKLGPSPFKIDAAISSENNLELKKIVVIGKLIKGLDEFEEKYKLDFNDPKPYILQLESFLENNKDALSQINPELFKACKFPKSNFEKDSYLGEIKSLLKLQQYQANYYILSQDFEKAKFSIIKLNQINSELIKKPTGLLCGMVVRQCKFMELSCIIQFVDQDQFTIEQKIEILNLKIEQYSKQFLNTIGYFETEYLNSILLEMRSTSSKKTNPFGLKPINNSILSNYNIQPNKTIKIYRDFILAASSKFENISENTTEKLNKLYFGKGLSIFKPNNYGKIIVSMMAPLFDNFAINLIGYNNTCNQLSLAKEILTFKLNTGSLPKHLEELKLDKKLYTDIFTNEPFLYFSENGILQSMGKNKKNERVDLTSKVLSQKEIRDLRNDEKYSDDFILYLK